MELILPSNDELIPAGNNGVYVQARWDVMMVLKNGKMKQRSLFEGKPVKN